MKMKLAGLALGMGMSLAAPAEVFHFTPVTNPGNAVLQELGDQLAMSVNSGGDNTVLFTFTNDGPTDSAISRVYFDDAPADLFASMTIEEEGPGVNFRSTASPTTLTGGTNVNFTATDSFGAVRPRFINGINNSAENPGEFLTIAGVLNAGRTFADVLASLAGGDEGDGNFLRVGLRVTAIEEFNEGGAGSFVDVGGGSPVPIPEPGTYTMLLAGLGLMTAIARRRQSAN